MYLCLSFCLSLFCLSIYVSFTFFFLYNLHIQTFSRFFFITQTRSKFFSCLAGERELFKFYRRVVECYGFTNYESTITKIFECFEVKKWVFVNSNTDSGISLPSLSPSNLFPTILIYFRLLVQIAFFYNVFKSERSFPT